MDLFKEHQTELVEHVTAGGFSAEEANLPTYSPSLSKNVAKEIKSYIENNNISAVFDLGSGDLMLPVYLTQHLDITVVAYEINRPLVEDAKTYWKHYDLWNVGQIVVRTEDFRKDIEQISGTENAVVVICGQSNHIDPENFSDIPVLHSQVGNELSIYEDET
jgi:hypothetical protein